MTEPYNDPYTQMEARAMNKADEARERIERIVRTLRPTDPGSWGPNIMYVTKEFEGFEAAVREECAKDKAQLVHQLRLAHRMLLQTDWRHEEAFMNEITEAIRTGT